MILRCLLEALPLSDGCCRSGMFLGIHVRTAASGDGGGDDDGIHSSHSTKPVLRRIPLRNGKTVFVRIADAHLSVVTVSLYACPDDFSAKKFFAFCLGVSSDCGVVPALRICRSRR